MSHATLQDDGLDTCYQISEAAPRVRALPTTATMMRGAAYGLLVIGALAMGLLAMQPGGLALDELLGGQSMMQGRSEGACCSQLKMEIPSEATPEQLAGE